jgi:signal peptidase I
LARITKIIQIIWQIKMKRAILLTLIVVACIVGFLTIRGTMPFIPVMGSSMEPTFSAGSLLLIHPIESPEDIEVGDIIVYNVPAPVQEIYNYPSMVVHRVIKIEKTARGLFFRTKGDNTGEDPFTIRTQDLRGTVSTEIPFIGFPLLFFQSKQGLVFLIIGLSLLAVYLYSGEVTRGRQIVHNKLFAPVLEQNQRGNWEITHRMETTEKAMESTHQALQSFSEAMAEYAVHLKSHTSAIQGLSEASQELRKGASDQNRILGSLVQRLEQAPARVEPRAKEIIVREKGKPPLEKITRPAGTDQVIIEVQVSPRIEPVVAGEPAPPATTAAVQPASRGEEAIAEPERDDYPPGCYQIRRAPSRKLTLAEKQNRILKRVNDTENSQVEVREPAGKWSASKSHAAAAKKLIARKVNTHTGDTRSKK